MPLGRICSSIVFILITVVFYHTVSLQCVISLWTDIYQSGPTRILSLAPQQGWAMQEVLNICCWFRQMTSDKMSLPSSFSLHVPKCVLVFRSRDPNNL